MIAKEKAAPIFNENKTTENPVATTNLINDDIPSSNFLSDDDMETPEAF